MHMSPMRSPSTNHGARSDSDLQTLRRLNVALQEASDLKRTVFEFTESLERARVRNSELEAASNRFKEEIAVQKRKECPQGRFRGPGAAPRGIRGSEMAEKGKKKKAQTPLNIALEAAIELDANNIYSGKPVILVSSLYSKFATRVATSVVNQLHPRPLRRDSYFHEGRQSEESFPVLQHWWLPKMQELYSGNGSPIFPRSSVDAAPSINRRVLGWVPKIPLSHSVRPVDVGGMIATPGIFGAQRGEDQFKAFAAELQDAHAGRPDLCQLYRRGRGGHGPAESGPQFDSRGSKENTYEAIKQHEVYSNFAVFEGARVQQLEGLLKILHAK